MSLMNERPVVSEPAARELLEKMHTFPGPFLFKAIGRGDETFIAAVVAVVHAELPPDRKVPYEVQHSSGGKHLSVTLTPHVDNVDQVLAIYDKLQVVEGLRMLL
jgi:uncharacterized protein